MKTTILTAAAVCFIVPYGAFAGGHEASGGSDASQRRGPPPAVVTQRNLGQSGILTSFYSGREYGLLRARGGEDNARVGTAGASGIEDGYEHEAKGLIVTFTGRKLLSGGASYLTFGAGINNKYEAPNQTDFDTSIPSVSVGYQNFANPNAAYAAQLIYAERSTDGGVVTSDRDTVELRLDYARKLSDSWGVTGRFHGTAGDLIVTTPGGTTTEPETTAYTQLELVGNFGGNGAGFVPEGWKLHPYLGVSFDTNTVETSAGDETNDTGAVWAKGTLVKSARPGTWSPNVTLGIEHVYLRDKGDFIDEDTFVALGAGASRMDKMGNVLNFVVETRQGVNGNRSNTAFVTTYTYNF